MSQPPPIEGILETILYVDDLPRAVAFYREVLGFSVMAGDGVRFQVFQTASRQALLLFKRGGTLSTTTVPGGVIPPHDGSGPHHLGFAVTPEAYDQWLVRLPALGIRIESQAKWPPGGRSLYFRDPDGHLLELITPGIWPNY